MNDAARSERATNDDERRRADEVSLKVITDALEIRNASSFWWKTKAKRLFSRVTDGRPARIVDEKISAFEAERDGKTPRRRLLRITRAPAPRQSSAMGKGGNASAAGPKPVGKGLNPDRQYTQIRGEVRVAPRARRSSLRRTRRPVSRTTRHQAVCAIQSVVKMATSTSSRSRALADPRDTLASSLLMPP